MNDDVVIDVVKAMGDTCYGVPRGVGEMGPFLEQQLSRWSRCRPRI